MYPLIKFKGPWALWGPGKITRFRFFFFFFLGGGVVKGLGLGVGVHLSLGQFRV